MSNEQVRFASGTIIMLAIWQVLSPLTLGYTSSMAALWDAILVGVAVLALALYRMFRPAGTPVLSGINMILGLWLAASPFALGTSSVGAVLWNDVAIGVAIVFFALVGLALTEPMQRA